MITVVCPKCQSAKLVALNASTERIKQTTCNICGTRFDFEQASKKSEARDKTSPDDLPGAFREVRGAPSKILPNNQSVKVDEANFDSLFEELNADEVFDLNPPVQSDTPIPLSGRIPQTQPALGGVPPAADVLYSDLPALASAPIKPDPPPSPARAGTTKPPSATQSPTQKETLFDGSQFYADLPSAEPQSIIPDDLPGHAPEGESTFILNADDDIIMPLEAEDLPTPSKPSPVKEPPTKAPPKAPEPARPTPVNANPSTRAAPPADTARTLPSDLPTSSVRPSAQASQPKPPMPIPGADIQAPQLMTLLEGIADLAPSVATPTQDAAPPKKQPATPVPSKPVSVAKPEPKAAPKPVEQRVDFASAGFEADLADDDIAVDFESNDDVSFDSDVSIPKKATRQRSTGKPFKQVALVALLLVIGLFVVWVGTQSSFVASLRSTGDADALLDEPETPRAQTKAPAASQPSKGTQADAATRMPQVTLDASNVDALTCVQLQAAASVHRESVRGSPDGLALWALYRLATSCGDRNARTLLVDTTDASLEDTTDELRAAATLGKAVLRSDFAWAIKTGEALIDSTFKDSAVVHYATGEAHAERETSGGKHDGSRAIALYQQALAQKPTLIDAEFGMAAILLHKRDIAKATRTLIDLTSRNDVDTAVRAATLIMSTQETKILDTILSALKSSDQAPLVAEARRDQALRLLAHKSIRQGNFDAAIAVERLRLQANPHNLDAVLELSRLSSGREGVDAVLNDALRSFTVPADQALITLELVRNALVQRNIDAAKKALQKMGVIAPDQAQAIASLKLAEGDIALAEGKTAIASTLYAAARKSFPDRADVAFAELRVRPGDAAAYVSRLTQLTRQHHFGPAQFELARQLFRKGDTAQAFALLDDLLWREPTAAGTLATLAAWLVARSGNDEATHALAIAKTLIEQIKTPNQLPRSLANVVNEIANAAMKPELAIDVTRTWSKSEPNNHVYAILLASAFNNAGQPDEARALLVPLHQGKTELRSAFLLLELGRAWGPRDAVKARAYIKEAIAIAPEADYYAALGEIEEARESSEDALVAYSKAVELDPERIPLHLAIAKLQLRAGKTDTAIKQLAEVLRRDPAHVEAAQLLGDAYSESDQPEAAVAAYTSALAAGSDDVELVLKIAEIQIDDLSEIPQAIKTLRQAIQMAPKNAEAHRRLGYALRDKGQTRDARKELDSYLKLAPKGAYADEVRRDLRDMEL